MKLTGAQILIKCLLAENIDHIFGYPGGAVLHIYDELFKEKLIQHILVRHEQAAVHAADAYSRSSHKTGVALVTSGPGVTNAVTGIATAYMDSIPMVIITGQVPATVIGEDAFQECDTVGITRPCVKHNFLVRDVTTLAETLKKAFYIARTGRPGPVVVDIPKDISAEKCLFSGYPDNIHMRSYNPVRKGHVGQIKRAASLIQKATKPIIYFGGGIILSNATKPLFDFAKLTGFPLTGTLMGLGGYPSSDQQFLGMPGMHGRYAANMALQESDLVIAVGSRFDDRVIGNPEHFQKQARTIIHIDVDPASIAKRVKVDLPIVGDVGEILTAINEKLTKSNKANTGQWWQTIDTWRAVNCQKYKQNETVIAPQYVIQTLHDVTKGDIFITSDVGQHQMWAAQYYGFDKPRRWINSGGLGTMGVGLPYAMGVLFANPNAEVACVTGEASIQMCIQELSTCKQYRLPVKIINLNNGYLGMVRQWQEMFHGNRYAESYMESLPDFVALAESYGHVGMRITDPAQVKPALEAAYTEHKDRLVFLDFQTDPTANVYPMVAAGKGLSEMILAEV